MRTRLCLALALLALTTMVSTAPLSAQNRWRELYRDDIRHISAYPLAESSVYPQADPDSTGQVHTFLTRWEYVSTQFTEERTPFDVAIYQYDYNCASRRIRLRSVVFYNADGQAAARNDVPAVRMSWAPVPPNTISEKVYLAICGR